MTTIHDVANLAGVSVTTVSNVINSRGKFSIATKDKVEKAINELHYIPNQIARGLKTNNTNNLSVICEDINSIFSDNMIDGICDYADSHNYSITLSNLGMSRKMTNHPHFEYRKGEESQAFKDSLNNAISNTLTARSTGVLYVGIHSRDITGLVPDLGIPIVYLYSYTRNKSDTCINYDDFQGAKLAVTHLVQQGHTRIGAICGAIDSVPAHKRLLGYQTALMENNINFYPEYLATGDWHFEDGYSCFHKLINLPEPPTAVFVMSDLMAYGALNCAHDIDIRIPEDIAIIGFDNLPYSKYFYPQLSSIQVPLYDMGKYAAEALIKLITEDNTQNHSHLFPCELIKRKSSVKVD